MSDLPSAPPTVQPQAPPGPGARLLDLGVLLLLLGCGCWFWLAFFGYGRLALRFEDWPLQAYYLDITRLGLSHGEIPWICNWFAHGTDKFLVVPETLLTPDILLLPWLSSGMFVALHTCLVFGAGVWGWWAVRKRLRWSREAFLLAAVGTSFNGFVVAHLAAGHLMWSGCFLAPWVLLGLLGILAPSAPRFCWLPLAFSLFALFLLGAFHLAIWWFFFIGMVCLARPRAIPPAFYAVASACALALFRILPAKLFIYEQFSFLSGYPSLGRLLEAFTVIKGYTRGVPSNLPFTASRLGWWEFNHYTGWALLWFVILGALGTLVFKRKELPFALPVAAASLGMALLAYGNVYGWLYPIPLFQTERVATRLINPSFLGLFFLALCGLESAQGGRARRLGRLLCLGVLACALPDLWAAAQPWMLSNLEPSQPFSYYFPGLENLAPALLPDAHQPGYKSAVIGTTLFSCVCLRVLSRLWRAAPATKEKSL